MEKAFDILESSAREKSSNCEKIILLLTDGQNDGALDPEDVIAQRNTLDINARIFTYALGGNDANPLESSQMKRIACSNRGAFHQILDADGDNLKAIMAGYFTIMAAGVQEGAVRWADWYEDGEGLGMYTGACRTVYDRYKENLQGVPVMFGVTCVGIARPTFEALTGSAVTWEQIQGDNKQCADTSSLDFEAMEILRRNIGPNAVCGGSVTVDDNGQEVWSASTKKEEEDGGVGLIIGIAAAAVVGVLILGFVCSKKGGAPAEKKIEPTAQPQPAVPQGQVVAVY